MREPRYNLDSNLGVQLRIGSFHSRAFQSYVLQDNISKPDKSVFLYALHINSCICIYVYLYIVIILYTLHTLIENYCEMHRSVKYSA